MNAATQPNTRIAYIYDESDTQGPWVPRCETCIRFEAWSFDDIDAIEYMSAADAADMQCACCGATTCGG